MLCWFLAYGRRKGLGNLPTSTEGMISSRAASFSSTSRGSIGVVDYAAVYAIVRYRVTGGASVALDASASSITFYSVGRSNSLASSFRSSSFFFTIRLILS